MSNLDSPCETLGGLNKKYMYALSMLPNFVCARARVILPNNLCIIHPCVRIAQFFRVGPSDSISGVRVLSSSTRIKFILSLLNFQNKFLPLDILLCSIYIKIPGTPKLKLKFLSSSP